MNRSRRMRDQATIEVKQKVKDEAGGHSETWIEFKKVWVDIEEGSGKEIIENNQRVAINSTKITLRYIDGVTEQMRVVCRGREYRIIAPPINQGLMNRELTLLCDGRAEI